MLKDIVDYLEVEEFGTKGTNLFLHFMPAEVEKGILVTQQTSNDINPYILERRGSFQIIARDRNYDDPDLLLKRISDVLRVQGLELETCYFYYINPRHEPLMYPRADSNLIEGSVNFDYAYRLR